MHMSVSLCNMCILDYFDQIWLIEISLDFRIFKCTLLNSNMPFRPLSFLSLECVINYRISLWCHNQRKKYKKKKTNTLAP